jgi:protein gp37
LDIAGMLPADWGDGWANVWLGTTTENQIEATRRIPYLVAIPAAARFLCVEPMLEAIDLSPWLGELDWLTSAVSQVSAAARGQCIPTVCAICAIRFGPPAARFF